MSPIKAPPNLPELVRTAFNKARASGDVNFYPTQVTLVDVNSIPFQLRFSPSLANKPKAPKPVGQIDHRVPSPPSTTSIGSQPTPSENGFPEPPRKKLVFDPFDNPSPAMLICPLPPHHNLVLNKFAIVPEHFILCTRGYKEQTHLLEREDLEAVRGCIEVYHHRYDQKYNGERRSDGNETTVGKEPKLFAFFNCGEHSGASQPHRHLQLLVVEKMREGLECVETERETETKEGEGKKKKRWEVLAQKLVEDNNNNNNNKETEKKLLPFKTFAERLTPEMSGEEVHQIYLGLYRRAREAVRLYQLSLQQSRASQQDSTTTKGAAEEEEEKADEIQTGGEATISYNLAMTRDVMVIVPRLAEGSAITEKNPETGEEVVVGKLALNGTVLAGTALVKSQREWDALRKNPEKVGELLRVIGVPNDCEGERGEGRKEGRKGML
ncbi:ATP adenylyltransferase-domain-containing protein [Neurospora hispaniola]|uniref:ATP adenylyltransferase-domain-containing protein n=1 Tax=Neurospora hispaniola TaxID=588809 RepID=A0AAJ0MTB6_9PEZI|nr:ATP adenylyltransferase-domain-containing protein [Neurospora hispaniola]